MQSLSRTPTRHRADALPPFLCVHAMLFCIRRQVPDVPARRSRLCKSVCSVMDLQYNGHAYSKRFSRELIALMCAAASPPCNAAVDWRRSSRRRLRVRDRCAARHLQRCSGRYFWPDGARFFCRAARGSPPRRSATPRDELELYAREHGYDREDGELSPARDSPRSSSGRLSNLSVEK
uniref:Late expression factor 6 n=4 Tax=Antheraea pernyi nuclear polyhedrosis virus TaxID=161494 RepID=A0A1V1FZS7_NPVAP|nr:late expression factor 6 [Antheraea pernyi nucleopolyhedrovirus]